MSFGKNSLGDIMIKMFSPFVPMEPVKHSIPFDDENYGFQIKWDGMRILAHISCGEVQLFNRKKHVRTLQYMEISSSLAVMFKHKDLIIDGEVIALLQGKPNFQQLMRRDWASDPRTIKHLMSKIPVTYVVFDIIYLDGNTLIDKPFRKRNELLHTLIESEDPIVLTDTFKGQGKSLFDVVKQKEFEGIVAKKLDSPYQIGKKSDNWLKIKNKRQLVTTIGGFICEGREVRSLLLGIFEEQNLIYLGRASSGLKADEAREIYNQLMNFIIPASPFSSPVPLAKKDDPFWVKPVFEVKVEFIEFTDDGFLRHPVIKELAL
jgi:bifunctional non-homologous end joining protein LigD